MNATKPLLSIGITSYQRKEQLVRCIKSIQTSYPQEVEILISDDASPDADEIKKAINQLSSISEIDIAFSTNETNLGYDMNLGSIIQKANGEFVFLLSDDDTIVDGALDNLIRYLHSNPEVGIIYSPFINLVTNKLGRKAHCRNQLIESGLSSCKRYVYDACLFSGLVFRKSAIKDIDSSTFRNLNYIQIYWFLHALMHHGGYFFSSPSVTYINDGFNAFGKVESSCNSDEERNHFLTDRSSVKSNLEFNKTLFQVIRMFDEKEGTNVMDAFAKQYSLHSITGLTLARQEGMQYFREYIHILKGLDIHLYPIVDIYIFLLSVFGTKVTTYLLSGFRRMVKKEH